ncbi:hypothetical protein GCM10025862_04120 [Arsenicicoccus piscis]|uniref:Uncharacterized protein n=1 Tax=Arsenicicoccus piscis TaxID=673954 RepID=A0ABQ6HIU4_9MICO|nr:hypothetical protein GCM10025862_04120 [Arsenicicoccus piscis]
MNRNSTTFRQVSGESRLVLADYVAAIVDSGFPGIMAGPTRARRLMLDSYLGTRLPAARWAIAAAPAGARGGLNGPDGFRVTGRRPPPPPRGR